MRRIAARRQVVHPICGETHEGRDWIETNLTFAALQTLAKKQRVFSHSIWHLRLDQTSAQRMK